jgi:hypothetical protein
LLGCLGASDRLARQRSRYARPCLEHLAAQRDEVRLAQPLGVGAKLLQVRPGEALDALARPLVGASVLGGILFLCFVGGVDKAS